jgi:hypothetical protein
MKKITLFSKGELTPENQFYLLCLLFTALVLQGCAPRQELVVSADASHQRFSGPSYPHASPNDAKPAMNLQVWYEFGGWAPDPKAYNNPDRTGVDQLYASTDKGPELILNAMGNRAVDPSTDFKSHITFRAGLEYILRRSGDGEQTTALNYLQVPVFALYKYQLRDAGTVFGGLGPYVAYGFAGGAFSGVDGFKRFDAGLGLTAGYKIPQSFSFSLGYDMGLANIQKNAFGDKAQNRGISLNVGYPLEKLIGKLKGK